MGKEQLTASEVATRTAVAAESSIPGEHPRFVPGTIVAKRYRVVAQVGRGGMGEVYRADDLRLGQSVALKFLPEALARDSAALARLRREVRVARQVSHPNVCRVFDIDDADGVPFITLEFVDGEDLASLLHRIGRLQPVKALQLAHQLCGGLAEIHRFGILHRDLKPANIMLDGRGNLRITDFGLAVVQHQIPHDELYAGTPAYMAPEQLAGHPPTQQADIYALGLILYELFTGKPYEKGAPKPSAYANDIDPAIGRAILHCLEKDPTARPRTAIMVASALPGGDPLAAAIAAGETPSPEMVAAAADEPAMTVWNAGLLLVGFIVAVAAILCLSHYSTLVGMAPPEKPPEVLVESTRQIINRLGYVEQPVDSVYWSEDNTGLLEYLSTTEDSRVWFRRLRENPPAERTLLWYRQSPRTFDTDTGAVTFKQPSPLEVSGMVTTAVDQQGHLRLLLVGTPQLEETRSSWPEPEWPALFDAAGLAPRDFSPVMPKWQPSMAFDKQAAWEGHYGGYPTHASAAAFHGRIVYFEVLRPWSRTERMTTEKFSLLKRISAAVFNTAFLVLLGVGLMLARRNFRSGRGDRDIAIKFGAVVFVLQMIWWVFKFHHTGVSGEFWRIAWGAGRSMFWGLYVAVLYLALEPLARRRWPQMLVSWMRAFSCRWHNPRLGRDILVGVVLGTAFPLVNYASRILPYVFNVREVTPYTHNGYFEVLGSLSHYIASLSMSAFEGIFWAVSNAVVLLILVLVLRRDWIALAVFAAYACLGDLQGAGSSSVGVGLSILLSLVNFTVVMYGLLRCGLLTATVSCVVLNLLWVCPLTLDASHWYFGRSALVLVIVTAIAVWAFHTATDRRPFFPTTVL